MKGLEIIQNKSELVSHRPHATLITAELNADAVGSFVSSLEESEPSIWNK